MSALDTFTKGVGSGFEGFARKSGPDTNGAKGLPPDLIVQEGARKSGLVLAIDIGAHGAAALLDDAGDLLDVVDLPTLPSDPACRPEISPALFAGIVRRWRPARAWVEWIGPRAGDRPADAALGGELAEPVDEPEPRTSRQGFALVPVPGAGCIPAAPFSAPIAGAFPGSAGPVPPVPAPPNPAPGVPAPGVPVPGSGVPFSVLPSIPVASWLAVGPAVCAMAAEPVSRQAAATSAKRDVFDMMFLPSKGAPSSGSSRRCLPPARINRGDGSLFRLGRTKRPTARAQRSTAP